MLTRSRRDLGGEADRRSDPVQLVQLLLDRGRPRRAGHPADRQIRAAYCAADCPGWALAGDRAHRYITPPGVVMGAPRPVRDQIFCRTDRVHAAVSLTAPGRPPRPGMQFRVVSGLVQRGRGRRPPVGLCVWRHTDHPLRRDTRWPPWRPGCRPYRQGARGYQELFASLAARPSRPRAWREASQAAYLYIVVILGERALLPRIACGLDPRVHGKQEPGRFHRNARFCMRGRLGVRCAPASEVLGRSSESLTRANVKRGRSVAIALVAVLRGCLADARVVIGTIAVITCCRDSCTR
jgi:hypothetical protein